MTANLANFFSVNNVVIPRDGPRCVSATLDFSSQNTIEIEGLLITTLGVMDYIQGMYIDNGDNPDPISFIAQQTRQRITCPPFSQGYYALLITNPPTITATTSAEADKKIKVHFYNVPIQSQTWSVEANTPAPPPVPVIDYFTYSENAVIMDGSSRIIFGPGATVAGFIIVNEAGNDPITINLSGNDAALGGITLNGGENFSFDNPYFVGTITAVGTSGDVVRIFASV